MDGHGRFYRRTSGSGAGIRQGAGAWRGGATELRATRSAGATPGPREGLPAERRLPGYCACHAGAGPTRTHDQHYTTVRPMPHGLRQHADLPGKLHHRRPQPHLRTLPRPWRPSGPAPLSQPHRRPRPNLTTNTATAVRLSVNGGSTCRTLGVELIALAVITLLTMVGHDQPSAMPVEARQSQDLSDISGSSNVLVGSRINDGKSRRRQRRSTQSRRRSPPDSLFDSASPIRPRQRASSTTESMTCGRGRSTVRA